MVQHKINYVKYIMTGIALYSALFFSLTSPPIFSVFGAGIEFLIIILVIISIDLNQYYVLAVFFIAGYIMDAYTMVLPGTHSAFFIIIISLILLTRDMIYRNSFVLRVFYIFFTVIVYNVFRLLFLIDIFSTGLILKLLLISPLVTVIVYLMFRFIRTIYIRNYDLVSK